MTRWWTFLGCLKHRPKIISTWEFFFNLPHILRSCNTPIFVPSCSVNEIIQQIVVIYLAYNYTYLKITLISLENILKLFELLQKILRSYNWYSMKHSLYCPWRFHGIWTIKRHCYALLCGITFISHKTVYATFVILFWCMSMTNII